jgi:hypothetical protein
MKNQTQLSPEGAAIAQAVARKTGLNTSVIAPNMRVHTPVKATEKTVELLDLSGPLMTMDVGGKDQNCSSLVCNDPFGILLGLNILIKDGIETRWSIVARREGVKLWTLDYDSEEQCEREIKLIRIWLDALMTKNDNYSFIGSKALKLTLFNPLTGQEL